MVDATGGSRPGEVGRGDQRAIGALPHHLAATALATVSNAVFITEPDGRIIWVNDAFTHMSGYSYAEAVGSTPRLLRSGVQDDAHYAQLWATILAGRPWRGEVVDRHRDGHLYTVWQTITPLVDDAGEVTHFVAVHEDVTTLRSDQARLQALFDHSPEAILLLDDDATVVEANPAAVTLTGRTGDALTGASIYELVPAGDQRTVERLIAALLDQGRIEGAGWFARGDGTRCKVEYTAVAAITDGLHLVLARDITERRQLEHDLREQTRLLERRAQEQTAIAEVGRFAVGLDDPEAVADEACQRVGELLGPGIEVEVSWDTTPDVTASSDDPPHVVDIGGSGVLIVDGPSARRLDDGDREFLHAMAHVLDTVVQRDLSNARLEHLADHDVITQLPNRNAFLRMIEEVRNDPRREGAPFTVLALDLDDFKAVNDGLGQDAGDEVLFEIAERLSKLIGPLDTVARLSSDEFALLCPSIVTAEEATDVAERVRAEVRTPIAVAAGEVTMTASVGLVLADGQVEAHGLLRDAATAVHAAKQHGRDGVVVFSPEMRTRASQRFDTASTLRRALDEDDVVVHYQPTIDLDTGLTVGIEALARLQLPNGELLPPGRFIPVAESTGMIAQLGERVLEIACRDAVTWLQLDPGFMLGVNVSPAELPGGGLARSVERCLARYDLPASVLWLELTESELLEAELARNHLSRLARLGVRFAIDDFGTGYSSLKQLRSTAVDMIKIDRTFVAGVVDNDLDRALVVAAIDLAGTFGLGVTAEGVETRAQANALRRLGCGLAQGFRWSGAVPAEQITERLAAER